MQTKISDAFSAVYQKLVAWMQQFILLLPNLLVAIVIFTVFYTLARQTRRFLAKPLSKFSHSPTLIDLMVNLVFIALLVFGLFIALSVLQLDKAVTSLLAGAGIIGLALGFAFQDIAANFVAGVLMAFRRPIELGDMIESNGIFGTVFRINLSSTVIRTPEGQHVFIPNKEIYNQPMTNYSTEGERRVDLKCGVSYKEDLVEVREITLDTIRSMETLVPEREVTFFYQEFGDSSINFTVRYWVKFQKQPDYLQAMSDGIIRLKQAFDKQGINIPFPIRTLDFSLPDGEKAVDQLRQFSPGK
jgi:small conductance mechanosensitive channel